MLHRLALRVLPSLSLAVTEDAIRKKKRIVMFVPGLVAFGIYRGAKHGFDLADPLTLLILSGLVSLLTAGGSYLIGRRLPFTRVLTEDGGMRVTWLLGWIGFVYGVQLSLLVLALLWLVGYDYGKHPDGPAMMAIIISCTAVARDAFEIGHVRWVEAAGRPFVTFPDGRALRGMLQSAPPVLWAWVGGGAIAALASSTLVPSLANAQVSVLVQAAVVTLVAGSVSLLAFFAGQGDGSGWKAKVLATSWMELSKFLWWPGLAFASTYYLVLVGLLLYVAKQAWPSSGMLAAVAAGVGGVMALYAYYLGHRRDVENREQGVLPSSLLRCPFVMGILGQSRTNVTGEAVGQVSVLGKSS
ncbi:MAG: hypothetical protein KF814_18210 [Nitrospiraceae bacterium]|nr:hypothetical protein [Nitrospiraceae bacterium]